MLSCKNERSGKQQHLLSHAAARHEVLSMPTRYEKLPRKFPARLTPADVQKVLTSTTDTRHLQTHRDYLR
jgi:hypothetical protein